MIDSNNMDKQQLKIIRRLISNYQELTEEKLYKELINLEIYNKSRYLFPNDIVLLYPSISENRAIKTYTCDFSGAVIQKGSIYVNYKALIENLSTSKKYVLKRDIKVETAYQSFLPTSFLEFEELNYKIENYEFFPNEEIDYSNMSIVLNGGLNLRKIKSK